MISFQSIVIMTMTIQNLTADKSTNFNVSTFNDHKGLYYESHGLIRTSHANWDLVIYTNIDLLTLKYDKIIAQYNSMGQVCKQMTNNFGNVRIENICNQFIQQFSSVTLPYIYEIQANRNKVMLSVGQEAKNENRFRRGLGRTFKRLINVLYGACSKIDVEFIFKQILELSKKKMQNIDLINERTRVIQVEANNPNNISQRITEHQQQLDENLKYLQKQTQENIMEIDMLKFQSKLFEQAFLFEVVLNQYANEIQNLIAIVNAALSGKVHTSVITPGNLMKELKEIKMNLPTDNTLPIEIIPEAISDLLRISEITIFIQQEYLIFSITIPLISNKEFYVYRPIPLPILYNRNTLILIDPEIEYLALSNDNEEFFSLNTKHWENCLSLNTHKICKGNQIFYRKSRINICEIAILTYQTIPDNCKLKMINLNTPIWDRLARGNAWLFYSPPTTITIKCTEPSQIITTEISGIGRLTTSPNCETHTEHSILYPTSIPNREINDDLIPETNTNKFLSELSDSLKNKIPQNLREINIITDFSSLSRKLIEINRLQLLKTDHLEFFQTEFYIIIMYILFVILVFVINILILLFLG